jgi:hypothetical protein
MLSIIAIFLGTSDNNFSLKYLLKDAKLFFEKWFPQIIFEILVIFLIINKEKPGFDELIKNIFQSDNFFFFIFENITDIKYKA